MQSEAHEISLKNAVECIVDNRGKTAPTADTGIALIATNCVNNNDLYPRKLNLRYVSQETYATWFRAHPKPGDILLTNKGSQNGAVCLVPDPVDFCIAQDMVALRADPKKIYPLFLLAALRSEIVQQRIKRLNVDAVIPHLKKTDFDKLFVPLPNRALQEWIGDWYFQVSNRIELLQETNATLEAIAQALFKSWFVDFDPVRAKAEGRDSEGVPPEVADLFPSEFEQSELGPIPKGWAAGSVGQIAEVIDCLHSKKPELLPSGSPFLQLNNILDDGLLDLAEVTFISDSDYKNWTSRIEVRQGDCVITNVGRVGAVAQIPAGFTGAMGRNMTAIRLKTDWPYPTFLIELLQSQWMRAEIERLTDVGTILNALNVKSIPLLRCTLAGPAIMGAFEDISRPVRASMESNLQQQKTLATLRDTLLPRLMSGKLRIPHEGVVS